MWNFLSVVVTAATVAWITQRFIAWRETKLRLEERRLNAYLSMIPALSEFYKLALIGAKDPQEIANFYRQHIEILGTLSIIGSENVMLRFNEFCDYVFSKALERKEEIDEAEIRPLFSEVTYAMCCDVHDEGYKPPEARQERKAGQGSHA